MSSRVLRKLQGEKEKELTEELSDPETTSGGGGARRKQLNVNRYDLLNQQSHSESEVKEDDNETETVNAHDIDNHDAIKRKKKKKKKKSGKSSANTQRSSEDNADVDEVERSVREVNKLLGENYIPGPSNTDKVERNVIITRKGVLTVQHRHLNPNNELKRIFGSKIIPSEHNKRKNRGRGHLKSTWLVSGKDNWPQVGKPGLSMSLVESTSTHQLFKYEHNANYRQIQTKFLEAVESLNPDNIVSIINDHPYHVDALIQLSDLCRLSEDLAMAAELIERALFCLECAFHPLFNVAQGNCRLDYRIQENRSLFITIFKHLLFVGGRACYRTALEFCKLLLSLDPEGDPLAVTLALDFYALRSREYTWLIDFFNEWEPSRNLSQLPNFAFSLAIAHFHNQTVGAGSKACLADSLLQNALIMFPGSLMPLLEICSVQIDDRVKRHSFFGPASQNKQSPALQQLVQLYVNRCYHIWKENELLPWLEKNVHEVLDRVDNGDQFVKDCETKRAKLYQGQTPRNILRHIILSDIKGVSPNIPADVSDPMMSFDPLPPLDSINLYNKPKGPQPAQNSSTVGIFFQSLLPNFNVNAVEPYQLLDGEDGARGMAAGEGPDLRQSVASLVDAMRDLLSNIRLPDVPNDADVDDNSDEDEEQNNYLT